MESLIKNLKFASFCSRAARWLSIAALALQAAIIAKMVFMLVKGKKA